MGVREGGGERGGSVFRISCGVCWTVALALLFAGVTTGDAYLFDRLGGFSGGVSLAEPLLPASSLTRNTRNTVPVPVAGWRVCAHHALRQPHR